MRSASTRADCRTPRTALTRGRRRRWRRWLLRQVERPTASAISAPRPRRRVPSSKERVRPRPIATRRKRPSRPTSSPRFSSRSRSCSSVAAAALVGDGRRNEVGKRHFVRVRHEPARNPDERSGVGGFEHGSNGFVAGLRHASYPCGRTPQPAKRRDRDVGGIARLRVPRCGCGGVDELPGDPREVRASPVAGVPSFCGTSCRPLRGISTFLSLSGGCAIYLQPVLKVCLTSAAARRLKLRPTPELRLHAWGAMVD